jgi:hypothetical protein
MIGIKLLKNILLNGYCVNTHEPNEIIKRGIVTENQGTRKPFGELQWASRGKNEKTAQHQKSVIRNL